MRKIFKIFGGLGALAIVAGLAIGAYAFTNTITTPASVNAGYGTSPDNSYTASDITYTAADHVNASQVQFTLNANPTTLSNLQVSWYSSDATNLSTTAVWETGGTDCTNAALVWTCVVQGASTIPLQNVGSFQIEAIQ